MVEVPSIGDYGDILKKNGVIADQEERKRIIRDGLHAAAKKAGGVLLEDEELVDTVTFLVEDPQIMRMPVRPGLPETAGHRADRRDEGAPEIFLRDGRGRQAHEPLPRRVQQPSHGKREGGERAGDHGAFQRRAVLLQRGPQGEAGRQRSSRSRTCLFHKELGTIYDKVEPDAGHRRRTSPADWRSITAARRRSRAPCPSARPT